MIPPRRLAFRASILLIAILAASSCERGRPAGVSVKREQLFSLGYGQTEDQLALFQIAGEEAPQKPRIAMR